MATALEAPGQSYQYADLNIRHMGDAQKTLALVKRAIRMGYDTVAINIDMGDISSESCAEEHFLAEIEERDQTQADQPPPSKKQKRDKNQKQSQLDNERKKKEEKQPRERALPEPFLVDEDDLDLSPLEQHGKKFRQYSRITFTLNDASVIHNVFHNPKLKKFDIVAVRPGDESILNTLTRKTDTVDIISFDHTADRVGWAMKSKSMEMIRAEGVGFELCYRHALLGSCERRNVLTNGRSIIRGVRGRGVVVCSAAEFVVDLRAPVDVMNMLALWGVSAANARTMISGYPRQVLLRAESRRTVRGALHVTPIDRWVDEEGEQNIQAQVPARGRSQENALRRLLTVKEFHAQVEVVPKTVKPEPSVPMESS